MSRALRLARRGRGRVSPNPLVGAVVVRDGEVLAEGYHRRLGALHGEADALAKLHRGTARGATLYVNLEPCCHRGRTPPCVDAVLAAEIARVVVAHRDPNPLVSGGGLDRLRAAGVAVECGVLSADAARLNLPFLISHLLERPAVTLKWAMSLDGRIATHRGESQWITEDRSRRWALGLRQEHDAVLVGSGTVLADDPRLDRRAVRGRRTSPPNLRVVLDRRLRLPTDARLFDVAGPVLVYTSSTDAARRRQLEAAGAEVLRLVDASPRGSVREVTRDLHRRGVQSVLVEGGAEVHGAFFDAGVFDRFAVALGPVVLGGATAPGPVAGVGASTLATAQHVEGLRRYSRGGDSMLEGLRRGCLQDLLSSVVD